MRSQKILQLAARSKIKPGILCKVEDQEERGCMLQEMVRSGFAPNATSLSRVCRFYQKWMKMAISPDLSIITSVYLLAAKISI
jgi:hypothetical protein